MTRLFRPGEQADVATRIALMGQTAPDVPAWVISRGWQECGWLEPEKDQTDSRLVRFGAGVSGAQLWAMERVAAAPGIGVGRLARELAVHQSTASNLVNSVPVAGGIRHNEVESATPEERAAGCDVLLGAALASAVSIRR